jgi:probable rRNA maturation factor
MAAINYFTEDISFKLAHPRKIASWIKLAIKREKRTLQSLNYIFCSDRFLLSLNKRYLRHKTFTDVITFDLSEPDQKSIVGEIFISIDRISENAKEYSTSFENELHRVMIHGVLHLIGYGDKKTAEKTQMRKKEEAYLSLYL